MKKQLMAALLGLGLAAASANAQSVVVGGVIPLQAYAVGLGLTGIDLTSAGSNQTIATFYVTDNAPVWTLKLAFANGGRFKGIGLSSGATAIDMTKLNLVTTAAAPWGAASNMITTALTSANSDVIGGFGALAAFVTTASGGAMAPGTADAILVTGAPTGTPQTGASVNGPVTVQASWAASANPLAGIYTEVITATLISQI